MTCNHGEAQTFLQKEQLYRICNQTVTAFEKCKETINSLAAILDTLIDSNPIEETLVIDAWQNIWFRCYGRVYALRHICI